MKPRTKAFADALLKDPSKSQTQAYIETHDTDKPKTAVVQASKLMSKTNVKVYMKKVETEAKSKIAELIQSDKQDIALKASQDVLDRNIGKSVQRSVSQNTNINLDIPASKELADNFEEFMKRSTTI